MKKNIFVVSCAALAMTLSPAIAEETHNHHAPDHHAPDHHAPIGVMGDHTHKQGEFMIS